jgi:hypothetical protein
MRLLPFSAGLWRKCLISLACLSERFYYVFTAGRSGLSYYFYCGPKRALLLLIYKIYGTPTSCFINIMFSCTNIMFSVSTPCFLYQHHVIYLLIIIAGRSGLCIFYVIKFYSTIMILLRHIIYLPFVITSINYSIKLLFTILNGILSFYTYYLYIY